MDKVVLYSTGCPKCKILEQKLNMKSIPYEKTNDEERVYVCACIEGRG